jgi:hypothetical protein
MIVRCTECDLPRRWRGEYRGSESIILERDIRLCSLHMKLLVFPTLRSFRHFWVTSEPTRKGGPLGKAFGAVAALQCETRDYRTSDWPDPVLEVDRRYFAAMGLVRGHLGMEIITHECVHAAYSYAKRTGPRNPWACAVDERDGLDEELVCYPAGVLARKVVTVLRDADMFNKGYISLNGY